MSPNCGKKVGLLLRAASMPHNYELKLTDTISQQLHNHINKKPDLLKNREFPKDSQFIYPK